MLKNVIRTVPLPEDLVTAAPLSGYVNALLDSRSATLAHFSGEFDPTGLVRAITARLRKAQTYAELIFAIEELRNNAYFAAYVLKRTLDMPRKNIVFQPEMLTAAIAQQLREYRVDAHLIATNIDAPFVAQLIIDSHQGDADFHLVPPDLAGHSYIQKFASFYEAQRPGTGGKEEEARRINARSGSVSYEALVGAMNGRSPVLLGRIRTLDRIFPMLHSPAFWNMMFMADLTGGDPARNDSRKRSLETLAGICHAILLVEPLALAGLIEANHATVKKWLGPLPSLYARSTDYVSTYIKPYDVFDTFNDAAVVVEAMQAKGPSAVNVHATVLLEELNIMPQWAKMNRDYKALSRATANFNELMTDLKLIGEREFAPLVSSYPIGEVSGVGTIAQLTKLEEAYFTLTQAAASVIRDYTVEFLPKEILPFVKEKGVRMTFPLLTNFPLLGDVATASIKEVRGGDLDLAINVPAGSSFIERAMMGRHLLTFTTSVNVLDTYTQSHATDPERAEEIWKHLGENSYRTLYPAGYVRSGAKTFTREELGSAEAMLALIAQMTERPFFSLKQDLTMPTMQKLLATLSSSFCQFYLIGSKTRVMSEGSMKYIDAADGTTLIEPEGLPYGLEISEWSRCFSDVTDRAIVLIDGVIAYRIIGNYGLPTRDLTHFRMRTGRSYRIHKGAIPSKGSTDSFVDGADTQGMMIVGAEASLGRGASILGDKDGALVTGLFVMDKPMVHYTALPVLDSYGRANVLFDTRYFYANASIVAQLSPTDTAFAQSGSRIKVGLTPLKWNWSQAAIFDDLHGFGDELAAGGGEIVGAGLRGSVAANNESMARMKEKLERDGKAGARIPSTADAAHQAGKTISAMRGPTKHTPPPAAGDKRDVGRKGGKKDRKKDEGEAPKA